MGESVQWVLVWTAAVAYLTKSVEGNRTQEALDEYREWFGMLALHIVHTAWEAVVEQ